MHWHPILIAISVRRWLVNEPYRLQYGKQLSQICRSDLQGLVQVCQLGSPSPDKGQLLSQIFFSLRGLSNGLYPFDRLEISERSIGILANSKYTETSTSIQIPPIALGTFFQKPLPLRLRFQFVQVGSRHSDLTVQVGV